MGAKRPLTPAEVHEQDLVTPEELLDLAVIRRAARTDGKLPRRVTKRLRQDGLSAEQITIYSKQLLVDAFMAQDKAISLMHETNDPSTRRVALAAAIDAKDRVLGKPTEHVQVANKVIVYFGGVDPSRLPEPKTETPHKQQEVIDVPFREKSD